MIVYSKFCTNVKGNERGRVYAYDCSNTEDCPHFKNGKCVCEDLFFGEIKCPHAKRINLISPTTARAKSYYVWIERIREEYKADVKCANEKICLAGDYVFLPMAHLSNYMNSFKGVENGHFIPQEKFDPDMIEELVNYKPQALMGGTILSYGKSIPKFLQQLKEVLPEVYVSWEERYKETASKYDLSKANIGRTAYIHTLPQGSEIVDCHSNVWVVDGDQIICDHVETSIMLPFGKPPGSIAVTISNDMTARVLASTLVDENTEYVD